LQKAHGRDRPRLQWCPTGDFSFLPLHAAGIYNGDNQANISDYVVSSYAPSLSALLRSRKSFQPIANRDLKVLLVAESQAPGFARLSRVEEEVRLIADAVHGATATVLNDLDEVSAVNSVTSALPDAHILHLACHGKQKSDPLSSHFALRDGPLSVDALMKLDLPNAVFAFLSACETAKGDRSQPDQVVHLAASLLFCGFRSVIATMW
jgi:CHAT domain-containing protein